MEYFDLNLAIYISYGYKTQLRLTTNKREIKDFLKLSSATSFIRKTLAEVVPVKKYR